MDNSLIEKTKKYRSEGFDHGKIRRYLSNEGFDELQITSALKKMDNEEILAEFSRQKRREAFHKMLASILLTVITFGYTFYSFVRTDSIDLLSVAIFISAITSSVYHYRLSNKETNSREIFRKPKY
ncbi:hypothetical protein [Marinoscillum pacificum]|uniref:hypothetical protein n=1 Tax=Marinoscillum pacificum TaxID=392723 RepID=UPI002157C617|nr:hypothetical protein [Marinoscillum pacificum]